MHCYCPDKIMDKSNFEVAINSYKHCKEDALALKDLGIDAYRFYIPWTKDFVGWTPACSLLRFLYAGFCKVVLCPSCWFDGFSFWSMALLFLTHLVLVDGMAFNLFYDLFVPSDFFSSYFCFFWCPV